MPELPEVQTTVNGLNKHISNLIITDVWTDYGSAFHKGKDSIKNPLFFKKFKEEVIGSKITSVTRRAKNILIHIKKEDQKIIRKIILVHMKMTGHILYARYNFSKKEADKRGVWTPSANESRAFHDPFNRFIHFVVTLSNGRHMAMSDMRKFAKVTLIDESEATEMGADTVTETRKQRSIHLANIGPEPLDKNFTFDVFKTRLNLRPQGKIKTVLMDQSVIAGIGNIYSDEALWRTGLHPEERVKKNPDHLLKKLYADVKKVLEKGIDFGGDSMSDYRNIDGERGRFQEQHQAYRKTGKPCTLRIKGHICRGIIQRKIVGGRSAHFCSVHQKLL